VLIRFYKDHSLIECQSAGNPFTDRHSLKLNMSMFTKRNPRDEGSLKPASKKGWSFLGIVIFVLALCLNARAGQSILLGWDPDTNAVAGYAVHYGSVSQNYSARLDVGTNTEANFSNLQPGATNYFAVTAYDANGVESGYSTEVAYIVPGVIRFRPPAKAGDPVTLQFPVAAGHWYQVQATSDMHTWSIICSTSMMTSNCWNAFQDPKSKAFRSRFYRLILH